MKNRRIALLLTSCLIMIGVFAVGPSSAQACRTVGCFNAKIRSLNKKVSSLTSTLNQAIAAINKNTTVDNTLATCLKRVPVNQYGSSSGMFGYMWDNDGNGTVDFDTTALDITESGGTPTYYLLRDTCATFPVGRVAPRSIRRTP
jgi:hypothetical protein